MKLRNKRIIKNNSDSENSDSDSDTDIITYITSENSDSKKKIKVGDDAKKFINMLMFDFYNKIDEEQTETEYEEQSEQSETSEEISEIIEPNYQQELETQILEYNDNFKFNQQNNDFYKNVLKHDKELHKMLKNEKKTDLITNIVEHKYLSSFEKFSIISKYNNTEDKSDKAKQNAIIKTILNIPIGIYKQNETKNINNILNDARNKMDNIIYGMNNVKEELLDFVVKTLTDSNYKGTILGLQGEPGVGKCLGKDTEVLLYNGEIKKVQDITTKDLLMGPDNTPRYVLNTVTGREKMYKVINLETNEFYRINKSHIISLKNIFTKQTLNINVEKFINLENHIKKQYKGYKTIIHNFNIANENIINEFNFSLNENIKNKDLSKIKINSIKYRILTLIKLIQTKGYISKFINYCYIFDDDINFINDISFIAKSIGIKCLLLNEKVNDKYQLKMTYNNWDTLFNYETFGELNNIVNIDSCFLDLLYNIDIIEEEEDVYYGFEITDDHLFVLGDFTVTHNTRICNALSSILNLPFHQISLGGLTDPHILLGHSETYVGSKAGRIVQILQQSKCMNPIIYFDECDKIGSTDKNIEMNGVLTHILDEEQNKQFTDNYLENIKLDLSKVLFILSFNDITKLDPIVRNRMKIIKVQNPSVNDKINIVKNMIIPEYIKNLYIYNKYNVLINDSIIKYIINEKTIKEAGLRNIKKNIETILNKINTYIILKDCKDNKIIGKDFIYSKLDIEIIDNNIIINKNMIDIILNEPKVYEPWQMMYS